MGEPLAAGLYDGRSAVRHAVSIRLDGESLLIEPGGERVPLMLLRAAGERDRPSFHRVDVQGWRLDPDAALPPDWALRLPRQERHGGLLDRVDLRWALPLAAGLCVLIFVALAAGSAAVARLVPASWEIALGDRLSGGLDGGMCAGRDGRAALDRLTRRLAGPEGAPIRIGVVNLPLVNAAALPGRQIIVFRGLIDAAESPDEVAGVIAHEIGHVERRHPLIALVRGYGLSLLIGGIDGGALMQTLLANRYSRADEREADRLAIEGLDRANVSPRATAAFFDRLAREELSGRAAALAAFLSTHPLSAERRELFLSAARDQGAVHPALSDPDWYALRAICR